MSYPLFGLSCAGCSADTKKAKLVVVGIDGLGWRMLEGVLRDYMPNLTQLCQRYRYIKLTVDDAVSPRIWVRAFSGVDLPNYRLYITKVSGDKWRLIKRQELPVRFVWEEFPKSLKGIAMPD